MDLKNSGYHIYDLLYHAGTLQFACTVYLCASYILTCITQSVLVHNRKVPCILRRRNGILKYYLEEICVLHVSSSKTNSCSAYHWSARFSCCLKFNYPVQKSPVVVPTVSQRKLLKALSLRSILILSSLLQPDLPTSHFPSGIPTTILYAFSVCPVPATYPSTSTSLILSP
jgi:hypothetical protein